MPYWINQTDSCCAISVLGLEAIDPIAGSLSKKGRGSRVSVSYLCIRSIRDSSPRQTECRCSPYFEGSHIFA